MGTDRLKNKQADKQAEGPSALLTDGRIDRQHFLHTLLWIRTDFCSDRDLDLDPAIHINLYQDLIPDPVRIR